LNLARSAAVAELDGGWQGVWFPANSEVIVVKGRKGRLIRILVVDDNPAVRHYLRGLLEQQSTWRVCDEAPTGGEALQRVKEDPPDMILLDFQMPDVNGIDVARQVSQLFPQIPILMVTIHLSKQLAEEARKVGIRGVCSKSDVGSIVEAVDTLLHQGSYFPQMGSISH
jgi:two-component system, NarL family, invasion response regulator UvrY